VEIALKEFPATSDAELGRVCAVSHPFVGRVRAELQPVTVTGSVETRLGADGKSYPASKPARASSRAWDSVVIKDLSPMGDTTAAAHPGWLFCARN